MRRSTPIVLLAALTLVTLTPSHAPAAELPNEVCEGGFEKNPSTCWEVGTEAVEITTDFPKTGQRAALFCEGFGGSAQCQGSLGQTIELPDTVADATFSFAAAGTTTDEVNDCSTAVGIAMVGESQITPEVQSFGLCENLMDGEYHELTEENFAFDLVAWLNTRPTNEITFGVFGLTSSETESLYIDDVHLGLVGSTPPDLNKRAATFSLKEHLKAKGRVSLPEGGPNACIRNIDVKIQRKVDGSWRTIKTATTDADGLYVRSIPDNQGSYRAKLPLLPLGWEDTCGKRTSATETHKH